jgi:hypothetical protein
MAAGKGFICAGVLVALLTWHNVRSTGFKNEPGAPHRAPTPTVLSSQASGQAVIQNPRRPLSADAGRVLALKETLRIVDEGKGFFLKEPWGIDAAPDGSIYVQDGNKLYRFSPEGSFLAIWQGRARPANFRTR